MRLASRTESRRMRGGRVVSSDEIVSIVLGADGEKKASQVALAEGLSPNWIRVLRSVVATAYTYWQGQTLGELVKFAHQRRPLACCSRLAWDETGERRLNLLKYFKSFKCF